MNSKTHIKRFDLQGIIFDCIYTTHFKLKTK